MFIDSEHTESGAAMAHAGIGRIETLRVQLLDLPHLVTFTSSVVFPSLPALKVMDGVSPAEVISPLVIVHR